MESPVCLTCAHWRLKDSGDMGRQGFAFCNLGKRYTFFAPTHTCQKHAAAPAAAIEKRRALLKG